MGHRIDQSSRGSYQSFRAVAVIEPNFYFSEFAEASSEVG